MATISVPPVLGWHMGTGHSREAAEMYISAMLAVPATGGAAGNEGAPLCFIRNMLLEEQLLALPFERFALKTFRLHLEFLNFKTFSCTSFYRLHHSDVTIHPNGCRGSFNPYLADWPH